MDGKHTAMVYRSRCNGQRRPSPVNEGLSTAARGGPLGAPGE